MKQILSGLLLIVALCVGAQEFKYSVKGNASDTWVEINNLGADLSIEGTSGSEIRITTDDYQGPPEKAKGLKPLSSSGPENTGIGLSIAQDGNRITIAGTNRESDQSEYKILLPKDLNLKVDYGTWNTGDLIIKKMAGEVEAKAFSSDLELHDVTGPIIAHTLSSDLIVTMTQLSQNSPSSLTSTSGDIELTIPETTKGTFKMSTTSGGIYTDLDFDLGDEKIQRIGGMNAKGKLNGGGVEMSLRSVSGDVYVRRQ